MPRSGIRAKRNGLVGLSRRNAQPTRILMETGDADGNRTHMRLIDNQVHYLSATAPLSLDTPTGFEPA